MTTLRVPNFGALPGALSALGHALEGCTVALQELCNLSYESEEEIHSFLRSLCRIDGLRCVEILMGSRYTRIHPSCGETASLTLKAVEKNSHLVVLRIAFFVHVSGPRDDEDRVTVDKELERQIDFYISLNSCGRRLLSEPNISPPSLFPLVLARAAAGDEMDALFYFLREKRDLILDSSRPRVRGVKRPRPEDSYE
jgi:hypothetical protein